jgi:hypothetical protein
MFPFYGHNKELIAFNYQNIVHLHRTNRDTKVGWSKHDAQQVFSKAEQRK